MDESASNSPAAFTALGEATRQALSDRGFHSPTEPQRRAIDPISRGDNALVVAPTGTGKTETAMLPVFDSLEGTDRFGIGALYITPLRALNRDMRDRLEWWGDTLDLEVDVRHGDTTDYQRQKQANDPPDVLVTTPETLQAMLTGKKLRRALEDVEHVVVDEVHELAPSKRGAQLTIGLERLRELAGSFQRVGLSATVGDPAEVGRFLTGERGCAIVEIDVGSLLEIDVVTPTVREMDEEIAGQLVTDPAVASQVRTIDELVATHESTLVFVNTRQTAEALGSRLKEYGTDIGIHHGSLAADSRIEVEDAFKDGELDALLCTSSMELGIDVGRVDHVVQYNSPRQVSRLLQRVGRAGHRQHRTSAGTIITTSPDETFESIAIARKAQNGEVEPAQIHYGSRDTIANQIVGIVMDLGEVDARSAYEIVRRAYPFADISEAIFREIVRELHENRVIWLDEETDELSKRSGSWQYFYHNLSMIPDEATYTVQDGTSGRTVGTLDERFVVNFGSPGEVFIQRGEMWRITEIDEDDEAVHVTPVGDPAGEVPAWTGQEIPVPFDVAQEVAEIREVAASQLGAGGNLDSVAGDLSGRYDADVATLEEALEQIDNHEGPVPGPDRIVVESEGRDIVLLAAFGHKANETIGRLLSALIGQRTGSSVGLDVDPYRISLEVPQNVSGTDALEVLETTDPAHVEGLIELSLKNAEALKFRVAQVAAKFGSLKRWRGRGSQRFGRDRLLSALEDTPIYEEAIRELTHENLAIERASQILERIQSGDLSVETVGGRTAIGLGGRSGSQELLSPENADASVIQTLKDRIQDDRVILFCVHCESFRQTKPVRRVREKPQCPECESTRIAALNPWDEETITAVRATEKDDEQIRRTQRAHQAADLVQSHGKQAVIALAGRGVGPTNAARIINKLRENEDDFYRDILEREREYARTRSFW